MDSERIVVAGEAEEGALEQARVCSRTADYVALMADNHKGYAVPIGGVIAYKNSISPSGVGFDIGCGNKAVRLDVEGKEIRPRIATIMDRIHDAISFGIGRHNAEKVESPVLDAEAWSTVPREIRQLKSMAASQLGTVGSGNHYVDVFVDEEDRVWVGVHFGSRGLGHKTATHFLKAAGAKDGMDVEPCVLDMKSDLGQSYAVSMQLAGEYAYAGRDWVCSRVAKIIGGQEVESVHNHHNFAWMEKHGNDSYFVVRKGATPAFPGQRGFVGSSMAEASVILEGVDSPRSKELLYSTVHGAGRVMGRMEAKGKYKDGVCVREPRVDARAWQSQMRAAGVELRGGGLDEAPACYKRLPDVLDAHAGTIRVIHTLTPIGVAMAGANEFDPYKD